MYTASQLIREDETLKEFVKRYKNTFLEVTSGDLRLKRSHGYFYQIQGQLHITRRKVCHFIVFVNRIQPLFTERIARDEGFWSIKCFPGWRNFIKSVCCQN
ncbi:hypothetical protein PPYR_01447 [Photinus pyralis]|uniref:Uncharacterized protein n=1 Tax=Photinus pyralis TaxID=7054 RepID=A0A5N4B4D2_PHOPY|nr:hypothetical protein PPYR_01447 [Photinus pyralis]